MNKRLERYGFAAFTVLTRNERVPNATINLYKHSIHVKAEPFLRLFKATDPQAPKQKEWLEIFLKKKLCT